MPDAVTGESPLDEDIVRASFLVGPDRRPPCRRSRAVVACSWGATTRASRTNRSQNCRVPALRELAARGGYCRTRTPVALHSGTSPALSRSPPSFQSLTNGLLRAGGIEKALAGSKFRKRGQADPPRIGLRVTTTLTRPSMKREARKIDAFRSVQEIWEAQGPSGRMDEVVAEIVPHPATKFRPVSSTTCSSG